MTTMIPTMRPQNYELIVMKQPEDPQYAKKNGIIFPNSNNGGNLTPNDNNNNNNPTKNVFLQYATYKTARSVFLVLIKKIMSNYLHCLIFPFCHYRCDYFIYVSNVLTIKFVSLFVLLLSDQGFRMIPVPEPLNCYLTAFYEKIRPWYFLKNGRLVYHCFSFFCLL